jgi:prepilin-type N-terminal cleavage/methylation domain-containing protein
MILRRGVTLIELLIAIGVLSAITAVVGLTMPPATNSNATDIAAKLFDARDRALRTGKPVVTWLGDSGGPAAVALPDGSVIADSILIDRFTGRRMNSGEPVR